MHNAKICTQKAHGVVLLEAGFDLGSPLKTILKRSSSELAGHGSQTIYMCGYKLLNSGFSRQFKIVPSLLEATIFVIIDNWHCAMATYIKY